MRRLALFIRRIGVDPDLILTSPLTRAADTAAVIGAELNRDDHVIQDPRLRPGFGASELVQVIDTYPDAKCLMLVGHEPDLSDVIASVCRGTQVVLRKGGIAAVDIDAVDPSAGVLCWLAQPEHLALAT
jgi:phosphohistidine phosphatase